MVKALLTILMGSGAAYIWHAVDSSEFSTPVRMWALIVFMFQVAAVVSVWRKKP